MFVVFLILAIVLSLFLFMLFRHIRDLQTRIDHIDDRLLRTIRRLNETSPVEQQEVAKRPEIEPKTELADQKSEDIEEPASVAPIQPAKVEIPPTPPPIPEQEAPVEEVRADEAEVEESVPAVAFVESGAVEPTPPVEEKEDIGLEARLIGTWAPRIALVLLAIGVAFFARWATERLGPGAKVAVAYLGAIILFAVGRAFQKKLQNFAVPVMAGGLAVGFFVSFSSHFVPAMKCLPLAPALAWMLAGVIAIFLFAERWKSQPTAGLAIFLGHVSSFVAAGDADAFSLIVIVFLSAAAVIMFLRHDWLPLSIFAVVSAYFSHALWISVEHVKTSPELSFWINVSFLSSYYFIFLASDLIWWKRLGERGENAFSSAQRIVGRILGPTNLILYVAMVSFIYVGTKVYVDDIHWFFFGLAAIQAIVGLCQRSFDNKDYVFYPAIGVILLTIGFFSAFEALTLNLVLASEALILLLAAHRTRVWVFHLLAQAMLTINFVHYWAYTRGDESTLAYFAGGLVTASVYFLKASLEEIWYGGDTRIEWRGVADQGAISKPLAQAFDIAFSQIAPYIAYFHAAGGAIILINQCMRYFSTPNAALAISLFALGFTVVALVCRSLPLLLGYMLTLAGLLFFMSNLLIAKPESGLSLYLAFAGIVLISYLKRNAPSAVGYLFLWAGFIYFGAISISRYSEMPPWREWWIAAPVLAACCLWGTAAPYLIHDKAKRMGSRAIGKTALFLCIGLAFICITSGKDDSALYLPWIGLIAIVYVSLDRMSAGAETLGDEWGLKVAPIFAALCAAALVGFDTIVHIGSKVEFASWLALWALVVFLAAGLRRNIGFYLSGMLILAICYAPLLLKTRLSDRVMDNTLVSVWVFAVAIGVAKIHDFLLVGSNVSGRMKNAAEALNYFPYAIALFFLFRFFYHRTDFPWTTVYILICLVALYAVVSPIGMRRGALASYLFALLIHAMAFARFADLRRIESNALVPVFIFFALGIAFERALALLGGLDFNVGYKRPVKKGEGIEMRAGGFNITPMARGVMIVMAAAVLMLVIYNAAPLGPKWTTVGWSLVGTTLIGLGFLWRSSSYRRISLVVFAICLVRVFLVDTRNLTDMYRMMAFLTLAICFLAMAWLYTRFSEDIRKWL